MTSRRQATMLIVGGTLVALVAMLLIVGTFASGSSVEAHIKDTYRAAGNSGGTQQFVSDKPVEDVVDDLISSWKPADRLTDPGGVFLRYSKVLVAVRPRSPSGTSISVDDAKRGYALWHGFVGGWFGTYSGRAEGFRGGGPGTGK